ncbi:Ras-related protein Rab-15 [Myotis davidii]|uniref:small monomeric GTPase n=1 Tax=Myotis davidii TaxID=225400 RepID=L5LKZ4_MYODS|nr:Ras-related protein Rab-15 [Myotis davidii]
MLPIAEPMPRDQPSVSQERGSRAMVSLAEGQDSEPPAVGRRLVAALPFSEMFGPPGCLANIFALGSQGVDFKMKTIEVDGIKLRIQIWDTAGQERYQTITKQYYRRAQGIFLVYDISSERSYQHTMKWVNDVDEYVPEGVQKILIGNKAD